MSNRERDLGSRGEQALPDRSAGRHSRSKEQSGPLHKSSTLNPSTFSKERDGEDQAHDGSTAILEPRTEKDTIYEDIMNDDSDCIWKDYFLNLEEDLDENGQAYLRKKGDLENWVSAHYGKLDVLKVQQHKAVRATDTHTLATGISALSVEDAKIATDWREQYETTQLDMQRIWTEIPERKAKAVLDRIIKSDKFRDWIERPYFSKLLILDGRQCPGGRRCTNDQKCFKEEGYTDDKQCVRKFRTMSLLCLLIYKASEQIQLRGTIDCKPVSVDYLPLFFSCDGSASKNNSREFGEAIMLKSLVAQLLARYHKFDTTKLRTVAPKEHEDHVKDLGFLFDSLLFQLPKEVFVLCIVENIEYYLKPEVDEYFMSELQELTNMAYDPERREALKAGWKVLVTSRSEKVLRWLRLMNFNNNTLLKLSSPGTMVE